MGEFDDIEGHDPAAEEDATKPKAKKESEPEPETKPKK